MASKLLKYLTSFEPWRNLSIITVSHVRLSPNFRPETESATSSALCQKQTSTAPRKILWITKDGVAPHPVDGAKIG